MTCRSCGTTIADKAIVCYKCGTPTADLASMPRHAPVVRSVPWGAVGGVVVLAAVAVWLLWDAPDGSWAKIVGWVSGATALVGGAFLTWRVSGSAGSGRLRQK